MKIGTVHIGPLLFQAPTSWVFYPFNDVVLGCSDSRIGSLQISLAYRRALDSEADHEKCLSVASQFVGANLTLEFARTSATDLRGYGSRQTSDSFQRCWYRFVRDSLLLAIYQCQAGRIEQAAAEFEDASLIAATMELNESA